ncbi:MAG TPA: GNAT family N-acetyltransferase [Solirubrobacterales bacterium]
MSVALVSPAEDTSGEVSFTRDRIAFLVRPIRTEDAEALFEANFATVEYRDNEAMVAIAPGGELIGVARYIRQDDPERAEVAVAVADAWQRRGVGSQLLQELAVRAHHAGITSFVAIGLTKFDVVVPTDGSKALAAALSIASRHSPIEPQYSLARNRCGHECPAADSQGEEEPNASR